MESRRILFIIARGDSFGGSSLHVRDMSVRLREEGHRVRVLIGGDPSMEVPQRLAEKDIDFICIPSMGREMHPVRDFKSLCALRREARKFNPHLISTHSSKGGALGRLACVGMGTPVLYTPHCWAFVDGFPKADLYRRIEKLLAPLSTRIVTVSEDERQFGLSRGVGQAGRTLTIHNGVMDDPACHPQHREPGGKAIRIVMVGRFAEQKDHALLLRALSQVKDLEWELTLVGDGPARVDYEALTADLGLSERVHFAGYSSRVEEWLSRSDLFALITNWEGFPRSILEAMRAGLPILTSDVGGCREAVLDGETGRVVPHADEAALVVALREMLSDRERLEAMGQRGFEIYQKRFTFEPMYQSYSSLYEALIEKSAINSKNSALATSADDPVTVI